MRVKVTYQRVSSFWVVLATLEGKEIRYCTATTKEEATQKANDLAHQFRTLTVEGPEEVGGE